MVRRALAASLVVALGSLITDSVGAAPDPSRGPEPAAARPSGATLLEAEARREILAMVTSRYEHTTSVIESKGEFDYDCSGFVDYALARALPDAFATLRAATGPRPLARDFVVFISALRAPRGRWRRVSRAIDLVPGDIVAWLKPHDVVSSNTGHVMIARERPTPNPEDETEILVPITDATKRPHGPSDSRTQAEATGLGTGTIGLLVDADGAPRRYRWTGGFSPKIETTEIALGHLD